MGITVKVRFDLLKNIDTLKNPSATLSKRLGDVIIPEMRKVIAIGLSPVLGLGRFKEYKAQAAARELRAHAKQFTSGKGNLLSKKTKKAVKALRSKATSVSNTGYPYSLPKSVLNETGKRPRPVNLQLRGDMLDALESRPIRFGADIGIFGGKPKLMAETHNDGTQEPDIARRQFIPNQDGDQFIQTIQVKIRAVFENALSAIIEMSK